MAPNRVIGERGGQQFRERVLSSGEGIVRSNRLVTGVSLVARLRVLVKYLPNGWIPNILGNFHNFG